MFEEMLVKLCKAGITWGMAVTFCIMAAGSALADMDDGALPESGALRQVEASVGYRAVSSTGLPNRAREYDSLESGPTFNLAYRGGGEHAESFLDIHFLNENDYYIETDLNLRSQLRFNLFNERIYHNLDHFPYDAGAFPEARPDAIFLGETQVDYLDHDPYRGYHLNIEQTEAALRYKIPDYPAHINMKYWRWEKTGRRQLRFVDESCTSCHMQSRSLQVDQVTEEVTAGVDAHLGLIDLIFEQVVRTFRNRAATPIDTFEGNDLLAGGDYQHDHAPDARFTQSTLKAHSTLGGGFVASASASIGQRENESSLYDVFPVEAKTDFHKLAGDVTYIPYPKWTMNLRYRMLDLNQNSVSSISGAGYQEYGNPGTSQTFAVRSNVDLERSFYEASLSYRPTQRLTIKGNYHREDVHRGNTNGPIQHDGAANIIDPYWELPENETIQKARLTVSSRLLAKNALKFQAWYEFQVSDDPAYSISIENGHTLFASATYRHNPLWGGSASFRLRDIENTGHAVSQFDASATSVYFGKDRDQRQQNASLGFWIIPLAGLSLDLNYGYLASRIEQDLLYGNQPPSFSIKNKADYAQTVHTFSAGATMQIREDLNCRLEGYHIRSSASFSPDFPAETLDLGEATADDLKEISRVDLRQNGIKGRLAWKITEQWEASLELTFDDYDDQNSDMFDGSVETCMTSVSRTW